VRIGLANPGSAPAQLQLQIIKPDQSVQIVGFDPNYPFQLSCPSASPQYPCDGAANTYYALFYMPNNFNGSSTYTISVTSP
jgi:hypothetical protein